MVKLQHAPAQDLPDPAGEIVVVPRPVWVGAGYLDAGGRGGASHPRIGFPGWPGIVKRHDLGSGRHWHGLIVHSSHERPFTRVGGNETRLSAMPLSSTIRA